MSGSSTLLMLRCVPGARRSEVVGRYGDRWKLRLAAAPEKGRANAELVALLAERLDLPRSAVEITRGHTSRDKEVRIHGLSPAAVEERLGPD